MQIVCVPLITPVGLAFTNTTVAREGAEGHPLCVTITVYEPAVVAENVRFVAPPINTASLYHWLPVADDEVSRTEPPLQIVVGPPADIVGVAGVGLTVTDDVVVLEQLGAVLLVKVNVVLPADTPVTTPPFVTVATDGLLLTHVPPEAGDKFVVPSIHIDELPVILTTGKLKTFTVLLRIVEHPNSFVTV